MSTDLLTTAELAQLRADAAFTLPDTGVIKRPVPTSSNGIVEEEGTHTTVATVACRLDPIPANAARELYAAEREAPRTYFQLTMPYDADLRYNDRVTVNTIDVEVVLLFKQHSARLMVRALVFKVEGG